MVTDRAAVESAPSRALRGIGCAKAMRGLINYSSSDTRRIMRQPSSRIGEILGSGNEPELMHRDNPVVLPGKAPS